MSRRQVLLDWARYAGSQYVARLSTLVRGFVVARILGPTEYGKWIALLVIYELGAYVHLGILNGMDREIPFHLGKGEKEKAWNYRDSGFTAVLGFTSLFLLALVAMDLLNWKSYAPLTRFALPAAGIALLIENQIFLHYNLFRAQQRIGPPAEGWVVQGISNLALSIPFVLLFRVHGLFVALIASNLVTLAVLRARSDWRFGFRWNLGEKWRLLRRGAPILVYLFVEVLLRQVDKLVIIAFLSREMLGYYGIAFTVAQMLMYVTTAASFTIFPRFLAEYGKTGEIGSLARTLKEPTFAFSIFIPTFLGLVYLWIHIPIEHLLPKFLPGIAPMRILLCGTVFYSLASLSSYFLIAVNRTRVLLAGGLAIVGVEAVLTSLLAKRYGIEGVAAGAAVCQFLYGTILLGYALRLVPERERSTAGAVFRTYAPTLYVATIVAVLFRLLPPTEATLAGDIGMGLVRGGILAAATVPLWILLQRKTGVFTLAWDLLKRRKKP